MNPTLSLLSKILFAVFLLCVGDAALLMIFDSGDTVRVLPGTLSPVVGKLAKPLPDHYEFGTPDGAAAQDREHTLLNTKLLAYSSPNPGLSLDFVAVKGRVWRGALRVSEDARAGENTLLVWPRGEDPVPADASLAVRIFSTPEDLRRSYASFSMRYLGFTPWWLLAGILPLAAAGMVRVFLVSGRDDVRMQDQGAGPIYKLARRKTEWEIVFGLGRRHGVVEGERMLILDPSLQPLGEVTAFKVGSEAAQAVVGLDVPITPDCFVAKAAPEGGQGA
jgi:hypothetical protein